ncbi:MAG: MerR family transcriptional regulator [Lachnospiraceae bacterium]|nr:MerR family transcriptional regulator [Lachnospiraceae bacterium]
MKELMAKDVVKMLNISTRMLHYYDEMGLVVPRRKENGYRVYDEKDLTRLKVVIKYRRAKVPVKVIRELLDKPNYYDVKLMQEHLCKLQNEEAYLQENINVTKQIIKQNGGDLL